MPRIFIDKGLKLENCYEYYPIVKLQGVCIPSFDVGKKHFGVYIEQIHQGAKLCVYAGLWKLGDKITLQTQQRLIMLLDRLAHFFRIAKVSLVEQQRALNYQAVRLQQVCLTWMELRHPHVLAISIASDVKYRRMDGPLGDQKHKRKKWAVDKCLEIFTERDDGVVVFIRKLDELRLSQKEMELKGDDVCDAGLQLMGWMTTLKDSEKEKYYT